MMTLLHVLLLCFVPLIPAQDGANQTSTVLTSKQFMSGDLPESYHMATVSSELMDHVDVKNLSSTLKPNNGGIIEEDSAAEITDGEDGASKVVNTTLAPNISRDYSPSTKSYSTEAFKNKFASESKKSLNDSATTESDVREYSREYEPINDVGSSSPSGDLSTGSNVAGNIAKFISASNVAKPAVASTERIVARTNSNEFTSYSDVRSLSNTASTESIIAKAILKEFTPSSDNDRSQDDSAKTENIVTEPFNNEFAGQKDVSSVQNSLARLLNTSKSLLSSQQINNEHFASENNKTSDNKSGSDFTRSRLFIVDDREMEDSLEEQTPALGTQTTDGLLTKPYKVKKKILISRPKTVTDKLVLDKLDDVNKTDDHLKASSREDSTHIANDRQFYSYASSTTEVSGNRHMTSSLVITGIEKLVNNNLLNVIDTNRPIEEDTTENLLTRLPSRNKIKFDSNEYGPTGQTDWVPLVSEQPSDPDWSHFIPKVTTDNNLPENIRKRITSNPIRFPEPDKNQVIEIVDKNIVLTTKSQILTTEKAIGEPKKRENVTESKESDMDVASWTLASSTLTRQPVNISKAENIEFVSFVSPPNNTFYKRLREDIQHAFSRATEKYKLENVTKEHNQVLKNTIPDSVVVETTSEASHWQPVATVSPSVLASKETEENATLPSVEESTISPIDFKIQNINKESATEEIFDVERTVAYEIMKVTALPPNESSTQKELEQPTEKFIFSPSRDPPISATTENSKKTPTYITENMFNDNDIATNSDDAEETTTAISTTPKEFTTESSATRNLPEASKISFSIAKTTQRVTTVRTPFETITSMHNNPTTIAIEARTSYTTEVHPVQQNLEQLNYDNRTILLNNTTVEKSITDEITEDNVPAYLRLTVRTSEIELCHQLPNLRASILKILSEGTNRPVNPDWVVLLNLNPTICAPVLADKKPEDAQEKERPVNLFLMDEQGDFNKNLSETFLRLWGEAGLDFPLPILKVDFVTPIPEGVMEPSMGAGVVAAIVISCVAGLCLILLGVLFVIMKRRQKKFNYGQRCIPVSLDAYSLDSVSIRASGRRKGIRASKRSYGNAAFDDSEVPSHPLNFAGLANFSQEKEQMQQEFAVIPQVSPRADEMPPGTEARNRYANVIPLPETRVVLTTKEGVQHSDYINANFVKGLHSSENVYIAAQAPLESTLADWWRMIWEQQVKVILMLTALQENGVEKCADYLPPNEVTDSLRLFGDYQVTLKKRDVKDKYIVSTLQLKNMENSLWREVTHLWYVGWPDSGIPSEPNSLIAFLIEARSQMKTSSGSPAPTLVHCSPGTGRTGTVIACDMLIREFELKRLVDIPRCVHHLRRARAGAVQTKDQYAFVYQVLNTYATKLTGGALETI